MPIETKITLEYTPSDLPQRIAKFPQENHRRIMRFMTQAGIILEEVRPSYPAPSRKPQPFKTERQRKWFFAALRSGRISVPYRRTGQLGRSFKSEVTKSGPVEYQMRFGTNVDYAHWVVSEDRQARYHKGTWWTMATIKERAAPKITQAWRRTIQGMVRFLGGR